MRFLRDLALSWAVNAIVLAVVGLIVDGVDADSVRDWLVAAAVFGVLNTILKPILKVATLPIAVVTLSLAWFGVAMLMLKITDWLVGGFHIDGIRPLFWATIAVWAINVVLDFVPGPWRETRRDGRRAEARR